MEHLTFAARILQYNNPEASTQADPVPIADSGSVRRTWVLLMEQRARIPTSRPNTRSQVRLLTFSPESWLTRRKCLKCTMEDDGQYSFLSRILLAPSSVGLCFIQ